jgi:glycosyltransferase involved in cell wall biosynthesis
VRILIATHASLEVSGGEERMLLTLARALKLRGHDVRIANFSGLFANEARVTLNSVRASLGSIPIEPVGAMLGAGRILPIPSLRGFATLARAIRWSEIVIFGQYYAFDALMVALCRLLRRPVVCSQANALFRRFRDSPKDAVQEAYARTVGIRVLRRSTIVRVCNREDLALLNDRGHRNAILMYPLKGEFSAVANLADLPPPNDELAQRLRADPRFKAMVAGRMTHQKGVDLLAETIRLLAGKDPHLSEKLAVYLAGSARTPPLVEEAAHDQPSLVQNLGVLPREMFASFLSSADAVLVPSRYESFGMIAAEAQSLSKPVIATDITGLREIVVDGQTGLLLRAWDAVEFAAAIEQLMSLRSARPERWAQMQQAAQTHYASLLSPEQESAQFEELLTRMTRATRRAAG